MTRNDAHAHPRPDPDEVDYPSVLELTSLPREEARRLALEHAERFEEGEEVPHVENFEDPTDLRALLTDRRLELLRHVMHDPSESIRALAAELDRDVRQVHDDLRLFADHGIVHFRQEGNAKQPYVPYDRVEISMTILSDDAASDSSRARAG